jgi:hypothetical protein
MRLPFAWRRSRHGPPRGSELSWPEIIERLQAEKSAAEPTPASPEGNHAKAGGGAERADRRPARARDVNRSADVRSSKAKGEASSVAAKLASLGERVEAATARAMAAEAAAAKADEAARAAAEAQARAADSAGSAARATKLAEAAYQRSEKAADLAQGGEVRSREALSREEDLEAMLADLAERADAATTRASALEAAVAKAGESKARDAAKSAADAQARAADSAGSAARAVKMAKAAYQRAVKAAELADGGDVRSRHALEREAELEARITTLEGRVDAAAQRGDAAEAAASDAAQAADAAAKAQAEAADSAAAAARAVKIAKAAEARAAEAGGLAEGGEVRARDTIAREIALEARLARLEERAAAHEDAVARYLEVATRGEREWQEFIGRANEVESVVRDVRRGPLRVVNHSPAGESRVEPEEAPAEKVRNLRPRRRGPRSKKRQDAASGTKSEDQPAPQPLPVPGSDVELNSAGIDELRALGLSVNQASRVVSQREERGGFSSVGDLEALKGVPRDVIEKLKGPAKDA